MESAMEGTAGAGVGVLTDIEAMTSDPVAVIAGIMMTKIETGRETIIARVVAVDVGPQVLEGGGEGVTVEVEVLLEGETVVQSGMVVRRDVPELSSGTGRRKSKNLQPRLILRKTMVTMAMYQMIALMMGISNKSSNGNRVRRDTDLFMLLWFVFTLSIVCVFLWS